MKITCFKCSQLKTSPALLENFLPLACIALKLSHFSFACPMFVIFPLSFRMTTSIAAHPSPWIWPGHRSFCLVFLGTSNFFLSLFRGDSLKDIYIYLTNPKPYVWYESWYQIVPLRENGNGFPRCLGLYKRRWHWKGAGSFLPGSISCVTEF